MSFQFDTTKHESLNDSGMRDLPVGKHNYVIEKVTLEKVKADKTKKREHLAITLRHSDGGKYTQFLEITPKDKTEAEQTRARIAGQAFKAYCDAAGITGVITPAKFKAFAKKPVGIETAKTVQASTKKSYVNVRQIVKGGFSDEDLDATEAEEENEDDGEEEDAPAPKKSKKSKPAPPEDDDDDDEDEDEDEDDEEEEEPAPKKSKKSKPAPKKSKPAPPEDDDDDEDEDEDEEEDDDDDDDDEDPFA